MTVSGAAIAAIGGITVNAQNKRHVQVHTRKVNNIIGTRRYYLALYDQYQGHLYLHAYKSSAPPVSMWKYYTLACPPCIGFFARQPHGQSFSPVVLYGG